MVEFVVVNFKAKIHLRVATKKNQNFRVGRLYGMLRRAGKVSVPETVAGPLRHLTGGAGR